MSNRGEQALLKQSTILMFAVAIAGIVTGVISGAQSILFDGFFSLIATAIKVLMLITAKLIAKKSNERFQFGYWHLEPMVLLIEGSFLLLIGALPSFHKSAIWHLCCWWSCVFFKGWALAPSRPERRL